MTKCWKTVGFCYYKYPEDSYFKSNLEYDQLILLRIFTHKVQAPHSVNYVDPATT
jgi:hypothetical protein